MIDLAIGRTDRRTSGLQRVLQHSWRDGAIIAVFVVMAFAASLSGARRVDPVIVSPQTENQWFDGDIGRVFDNMSSRGSNQYRTKVHPLFSLFTFPVVAVVRLVLRTSSLTAVRVVMAFLAAAWTALLFVLLRLIGHDRVVSSAFTLLGATSAAAIFWFVVPETFPFGSFSILAAVALVALGSRRPIATVWYLAVSAFTLSWSTTNWMAGIFATFGRFPWRRAFQITANAFCVVVLLWGVEKFIFPSAQFFLGDREEGRYMMDPRAGGPLKIVQSFALHSIVMPPIREIPNRGRTAISVQASPAGSGGPLNVAATAAWVALLILGLWGFAVDKTHGPERQVLGLTLAGQLALHLVYGSETFSYSIHFAPLFIVLAAFSVLTRVRTAALLLALALIILVGINNSMEFQRAADFVRRLNPEAHRLDSRVQQHVDSHARLQRPQEKTQR